MPDAPILRIRAFRTAAAWEAWLEKHHATTAGIWLRIFKKDSGKPTVTYAEALDGALCYGWIDGLRKSHDGVSFIQRFTPRRPRSLWSRLNTSHVRRLQRLGRMRPSGLAAVAAARRDGRWQAAYDSPRKLKVPPDFLAAVAKNRAAHRLFKTLDRVNLFAIAWRLQTATSAAIRARRMAAILARLAAGKKLHD